MKQLNKIQTMLMACLMMVVSSVAQAEIRVDISRGNVEPVPTAVSDLYAEGEYTVYGQRIAKVISDNLDRSGLFRSLDKDAFIQSPKALLGLPRFADWRLIKSQLLISGSVKAEPNGQILVSVRLWDNWSDVMLTINSII